MGQNTETLSVESKDIIESKLQNKYFEFLIERGFLAEEKGPSALSPPNRRLQKYLWDPNVVKIIIDYFNNLKSNVKAWLKLEELEEGEADQLKKDGLIGGNEGISEKGCNIIIQIIEEFITLKIKPN